MNTTIYEEHPLKIPSIKTSTASTTMLLLTLLSLLLPILILAQPECQDPMPQTLPGLRDCADVISRFYSSLGPPFPAIITVSGFRKPRDGIRTPILYRNPVNPRSTCAIHIKTRQPTDEDTFATRYLADAGAYVLSGCFPSRTGTQWIGPRNVVGVALVNPRFRGFENLLAGFLNGGGSMKGNGTGDLADATA